MNAVSAFLYTPLPWLGIMYFVAYRHDLGRVARSLRDSARPTDWWSVCRHLSLVKESPERPAREVWRSPSLPAVLASALISLLWLLIPISSVWYYLCALQVCSALPLALLLRIRIGPLPYKPFKDFLPYPRLGTRIRHLQKRKDANKNPSISSGVTAVSTGGQTS